MKPRLETSQGAPPPPYQTTGNFGNGNPLILTSPSAQKRGYGKRTAVDCTVASTGLFLPFLSFFAWTDEDATYLFLTNPTWHRPPHLRPPRAPRISIGALNIQDVRGFGLAQVVWAVERRGYSVMLLKKTNIQTEAYSYNRLG